LILQNAIESSGSLDTQSIQAALDKMNISTFFGRIQFSAAVADHGLQIGHSMIDIQWQQDTSGKLAKQVVWPLGGATAKVLYPKR
jgi:hypothetical protein